MRTLFLILFLLLPLLAKENGPLFLNQHHFELHLGIDKDGGFIPAFRIPFRWNEHISSSVRFSQSMNTETGNMSGYAGRKTVQATVREISLNILSYHWGDSERSFMLGGGVAYERLERHEFGFFHYASLLEDVAFENSSDVHLWSPLLEVDFWIKNERLFLDVQSIVKVANFVLFEQEILFNPLLAPKSNDDRSVNMPMLQLSISPYVRLHPSLWVGLYGEANYMKISYERAVLHYSATDAFLFVSSALDFTEIILLAEGRIAFSKFSLGGAVPFVGGGVKYIREEMNSITEDGTIPYFSFGLEVF